MNGKQWQMAANDTDAYVALLGHPPIKEYLRFVKANAVDGQHLDDHDLLHDWRAANQRILEQQTTALEDVEVPELTPVSEELHQLAESKLEDPAIRRSIGVLPYQWTSVKLDQLIPWQRVANWTFVEHIQHSLSLRPTPEQLVDLIAGRTSVPSPLKVSALSASSFQFSSTSHDLRVLGAVPLDIENVSGYRPYGRAHSVLAVFVGFSANFMTAIYLRRRLVLLNGTHRACGLRSLRATHAPCLVYRINSDDDLDLVGLPGSRHDLERLAMTPRPPLLRDYFDPLLSKRFSVFKTRRLLQLDFTLTDFSIPT